jgi:peptidoglycan hydrolase-like protein with peptidoglycan-binding domain
VSATVKLRDYGVQVECLEAALVRNGQTLAGPNLYYDWSTYLAVEAYQRAKGLGVDGVAGPATLHALGIWGGTPIPTACTIATTVRVRDFGNQVLCLETALTKLGYTLAGPNLYFDWSTHLAVQAFQRSRSLVADGIAGPVTLRALGLWPNSPPPTTTPPPTTPTTPPRPPAPSATCKVSAAIQLRAYGTHVQCLEAALVNRGYTLAGPNLYYDWSTYLAVQAFQRSRGQVADGIAGPITLHALGIWNGPPPSLQGLPANSGTGRRIVYHRGQQRVWAVDASGNVIKTHRVSGRLYEPYRGTYSVYSRSLYTYSTGDPNVKWRYMVRFAYGPNGGRIGFHEIPNKFGVPLQSVAQLGQPLSGGCVRQSTPDAQWMWNWAGVGTKVVVI